MAVRFVSSKPDTRRIPRHTEAQWEEVKSTIIDLYVTKGLPLREVQRSLKQRFDFNASLRQYKSQLNKWDIYKYSKSQDSARTVESGRSDFKPEIPLENYIVGSELTESPATASLNQVDHECLPISTSTRPTYSGFETSTYRPSLPDKHSVVASTQKLSTSSRTKSTKSSSNWGCDGESSDSEKSSVFSLKRQDSSTDKPKRTQQTLYRNDRPLACPFAVVHPSKFPRCKIVVCRNIPGLKQHLYRVHKRPELYCPRCFETFASTDELMDHMRQRQSCELTVDPFTDRMTTAQSESLKRRSSGSERSVWFNIFRTLFPTHPLPSSPYLIDTDPTTATTHVVNVLRALGPSSVQALKDSGEIPYVSRDIVNDALDILTSEPNEDLSLFRETTGSAVSPHWGSNSAPLPDFSRGRSRLADFHSLSDQSTDVRLDDAAANIDTTIFSGQDLWLDFYASACDNNISDTIPSLEWQDISNIGIPNSSTPGALNLGPISWDSLEELQSNQEAKFLPQD